MMDLKESSNMCLINELPSAGSVSFGKSMEIWGWENAWNADAERVNIGYRTSNVQLVCGAKNNEKEQKNFIGKAGSIVPKNWEASRY